MYHICHICMYHVAHAWVDNCGESGTWRANHSKSRTTFFIRVPSRWDPWILLPSYVCRSQIHAHHPTTPSHGFFILEWCAERPCKRPSYLHNHCTRPVVDSKQAAPRSAGSFQKQKASARTRCCCLCYVCYACYPNADSLSTIAVDKIKAIHVYDFDNTRKDHATSSKLQKYISHH